MSVYMRSNDVWLGAAYDFFQFTRVQIAMASVLGIKPGKYVHHVGSLHIYEQHYGSAEDLKYSNDYTTIPSIVGSSWNQVQNFANSALAAATHPGEMIRFMLDPIEHWYATSMLKAIEKNKEKLKNE
jgi:thymidylate synthase